MNFAADWEKERAEILAELGQTLLTERWLERLRFKLFGHWSPAVVDQRLLIADMMQLRALRERLYAQ